MRLNQSATTLLSAALGSTALAFGTPRASRRAPGRGFPATAAPQSPARLNSRGIAAILPRFAAR
jgi:hypothetical protein